MYIGLLPDIPRNRRYAEEQLKRFESGLLPTDQWHDAASNVSNQKNCNKEDVFASSDLGRKLMAIERWDA